MRTLRSAAALLAGATSLEALVSLVAPLGFEGSPVVLDEDIRRALQLEWLVQHARVVRGPGLRRALLVVVDSTPSPLRDVVLRIAGRLARHAPQIVWLLAAIERSGSDVAVAAWSVGREPPQVFALVASRDRLVDSDAETYCALEASADADDLVTHARWLDVLGRASLTRRFYRALERAVATLADSLTGCPRATPAERRALALGCATRLLFLAFLEAKGWLDGDRGFLERTFSQCMQASAQYHAQVLLPLFFGTLNTPWTKRARVAKTFGRLPFLNGGLFAVTPLERRHRDGRFSDAALGGLIGGVLRQYRFTAREDRGTMSEAAIDPEMLGKAFESLMHPRDRHASGAYYTPEPMVERITNEALSHALASRRVPADQIAHVLRGGSSSPCDAKAIYDRLRRVRVLDPACGSGAFLVRALETLADAAERLDEPRGLAVRRREILARSIFGVDVNPTAVWLCELRLWLSVVIESGEHDPLQVPPLPNLDAQVQIGDALTGGGFEHWSSCPGGGRLVTRLRARYARSAGPRKRVLLRSLDRVQRLAALRAGQQALDRISHERRALLSLYRSADLFGKPPGPGAAVRAQLQKLRQLARALRARQRALRGGAALPFAFVSHFADVAEDGGFDAIVGNPPWVRVHEVSATERAHLRDTFAVARGAGWQTALTGPRTGRAFAGQVDLAALFIERSVSLCRPDGVVALLVPAKLWRSLAGAGVRRLLSDRTAMLALEDWSDAPAIFDAATYPSLLVARCLGTRARSSSDVPPEAAERARHRSGDVLSPPTTLLEDVHAL